MNLKSLFVYLNKILAEVFFIGEIRGAPGTWSSIFAVILLFIFSDFNNLLVTVLLFFFGVICSKYEEMNSKIADNPKIVIDEVLGIFVTFIFLPVNWWLLILGFILFRFFDIFKFAGIKRAQNLSGGWGIMIDDLLAGIISNLILRVFIFLI